MTRRELIESLRRAAEPVYGAREAASVARLVALKCFGFSQADYALESDREVDFDLSSEVGKCKVREDLKPQHTETYAKISNSSVNAAVADLLRQIAASCPVQYILGVADFDGLELTVGEGVLIPRPETEELVRWIVVNAIKRDALKLLDIGTGSGAIAIALAKRLPEADVTAIDISPDALKYARLNDAATGAGIDIRQADALDPQLDFGMFDIIVSNPPYIPAAERAAMADNVTKYEPAAALFVPDGDPLVFYRAVARLARRCLTPGGALYFEIHENAAERVTELLAAEGFREITVRKDINSKPRMVRCRP